MMCESSELPSKWWARIKYIDNFIDFVPVSQIAESQCDRNIKKKSFRPQHFKDFAPDKYYLVQTTKFSLYDDDTTEDTYFAQIGILGESREMVRRSTMANSWPVVQSVHEDCSEPTVRCDECQKSRENDIVINNKNPTKTLKLCEMCCNHARNKSYKLLALLCKLERDFCMLHESVDKELKSVSINTKMAKKRLLTDLCILDSSSNGINVSLMGLLVEERFEPIESLKRCLRGGFNATVLGHILMIAVINLAQNNGKELHCNGILMVKDGVQFLKYLEKDVRLLNDYLVHHHVEFVELEEFLTVQVDRIGEVQLQFNDMIAPAFEPAL